MQQVVLVRLDWDRTAIPLREAHRYFTVHVSPEPEHPFGRKGLWLASAWRQLGTPTAAGMLVLDGDVAIDPRDTAAMLAAVEGAPKFVHVASVRLWPASTKRAGWVHGHGKGDFSRDDDPDDPDVWGLSLTYLPRRLIEACVKAGLAGWAYPNVDRFIHREARRLKIPARVVREAEPKHLNY